MKKGSRPALQASKKGRRVPERRRALGAGVEDFVPWVAPISSRPPVSEDEDKMADLVHNFDAQKRKQGASFKRVTDATLEGVGEANQHPTGEGSDRKAIVIMDSPQMGFYGQSASKTMLSANLGEVSLTHAEVRESISLEEIASRPNKATSSRPGLSKPMLPDRLLLNSYIPPQRQAPPMEEVFALGPEDAKEIINLWKPFTRGDSPASIWNNCIHHYFGCR